jgi:transposase
MRAVYPSGITREQFSVTEYDLKSVRKATRPRTYDLYDIFCAVLYVLKEGCTWRGLPHDFPKRNIVYRITKYGARREKTAKPHCLTVFCRKWSCQGG